MATQCVIGLKDNLKQRGKSHEQKSKQQKEFKERTSQNYEGKEGCEERQEERKGELCIY
jgi:hypothetical protein